LKKKVEELKQREGNLEGHVEEAIDSIASKGPCEEREKLVDIST
jgi:hypothetical protein